MLLDLLEALSADLALRTRGKASFPVVCAWEGFPSPKTQREPLSAPGEEEFTLNFTELQFPRQAVSWLD